jgi:histidinol-phosphate aminotransferase
MSVSRRDFVRTVGIGGAGLSTSYLVGRDATLAAAAAAADDDAIIRLSNNENNRGPGPKTIAAVQASVTARIGRGYPPDHVSELTDAIARVEGVPRNAVIVGTGSGPLLEGGVHAFCGAGKALVTAAPTFGSPENTARRIGAPVRLIPVDGNLALDLDAMAQAARGAGLLYICNPNNPTGLAHTADAVERIVRRVKEASPGTAILIDEAYLHYAHDAAVRTVAPLAQQLPGVFVTRSFSKAHGMAGLRLGYAVGQPDTVQAIARAWQLGSINTLTAAAGIASLADPQHIADDVAENARVRNFTVKAFRDMGYAVLDSQSNHIFVDVKGSAGAFRDACLAARVQVGRDFPPFEKSHSRITLGTMDEMRRATSSAEC